MKALNHFTHECNSDLQCFLSGNMAPQNVKMKEVICVVKEIKSYIQYSIEGRKHIWVIPNLDCPRQKNSSISDSNENGYAFLELLCWYNMCPLTQLAKNVL